jgi:hypothetical protein
MRKEQLDYCRKWNHEHPESRRKSERKWNEKHPNRDNGNSVRVPKQWRAQAIAETIPLGDFCELCSATENLMRHHPDYAYPEFFITCCSSCHNFIHKGVE